MISRLKKFLFWPLGLTAAAISLLGTMSCSNIGYYAQCTTGHLSLIASRKPIADMIYEPKINPQLRANLEKVLQIRNFASQELQLPENGSYRSYVDLKRPYVVWNIVAAEEFGLRPVQWCFPVAGCVNYRGFFSKEKAEGFARNLQENGYDVYLYGVSAYSTLGWFDDPVLNTFFAREEEDLAGLIFHELAHQQVYVKNDSAFNESFAKTVEMAGVARWLTANGEADRIQSYLEDSRRHEEFIALVREYQQELQDLYASPMDDERKRQAKAAVFGQLRDSYEELKVGWQGYAGYDRWFAEVNNAKMASVNTYYTHVPAFQALLHRHLGDLGLFYQEVQKVGKMPKEQRLAFLNELRTEFVADLPEVGPPLSPGETTREKL